MFNQSECSNISHDQQKSVLNDQKIPGFVIQPVPGDGHYDALIEEVPEDIEEAACILASVDLETGRMTDPVRIIMTDDDENDSLVISMEGSNKEQSTLNALREGHENTSALMKVWALKGDFSESYGSGGLLNRSCRYINLSTSPVIKELFLGGYRDNHFQITVKTTSNDHYSVLKQAVINAGFPAPEFFDVDMKVLRVSSADPKMLNCFLNALKNADHTIGEIEADICLKVGLIALDPAAVLPTWQQCGSFTSIFRVGHGSKLHRQVTYKTGRADSVIKEFSFLGYTDASYMFSFEFNPTAGQFKQILISSKFAIEFDDFMLSCNGRFKFNGNNRQKFDSFLELLCEHSPHFSEIAEAFRQYVVPVIDQDCATSVSQTLQAGRFFNTKQYREEIQQLEREVDSETDQYISILGKRSSLEVLINDESKEIKARADAAEELCNNFFKLNHVERNLLPKLKLLEARLRNELDGGSSNPSDGLQDISEFGECRIM